MADKRKKNNGIFSSAGEALMIGLLVVLFVTPFVVATMLTPGYENPTAVAPQPQATQNVAQDTSSDDSVVLGVEAHSDSDIAMLVPKGLESTRLESYVTSATDGEFLYSILSLESEKVLTLENRGEASAEIELRFNRDYTGDIYVGSQLMSGESVSVGIDPGEDVTVTINPEASGRLRIWVIVK